MNMNASTKETLHTYSATLGYAKAPYYPASNMSRRTTSSKRSRSKRRRRSGWKLHGPSREASRQDTDSNQSRSRCGGHPKAKRHAGVGVQQHTTDSFQKNLATSWWVDINRKLFRRSSILWVHVISVAPFRDTVYTENKEEEDYYALNPKSLNLNL